MIVSDSESDGTMRLDAMKTAALDPQSFADASSNGSWAEAMADHVAANEVDIQLLVQQLVASGLAAPPPSLHGSLESIDGVDDQALFTFSSLGSISAAMAGVPSEYVMSLTVDPDDTVRLGGTLYWLPTRYLGSVVEKTALGDGNQPSSFEEALSDAASCQSLTLDGYDGCDNQCIIELCENGLAQRWATALDASAANLQSVDVPLLASGVVIHDDDATLTGFEGSWLGNITGAGAEVKVSGNASATPKAPEPSR